MPDSPCAYCGEPPEPGDQFCVACGRALAHAGGESVLLLAACGLLTAALAATFVWSAGARWGGVDRLPSEFSALEDWVAAFLETVIVVALVAWTTWCVNRLTRVRSKGAAGIVAGVGFGLFAASTTGTVALWT